MRNIFFKYFNPGSIVNWNCYSNKWVHMEAHWTIEATPSKNWYPTNAEEIKAFPVYILSWVFYNPPDQDMYWYKDKLFHPSIIEMKFSPTRYENLMKYFHVPDTFRNVVNII